MPTLREAQELQALAQIALPAVRRGRALSAALPCRADRYRLRAAVLRLLRGVPLSIDARLAAVEYTDTHGFTEQLFGLCYLLGYSFMPRLRDLKDQQLYKIDRTVSYGELNILFRSAVDTGLIREQWDQLVRVTSSLRNRTAPAHVVLERLAASSPSDRLARALTMLGRIVKTTYILRYLHDAAIRDRVQLQLNRGESRHELARNLFFANQGSFRTGDYEEIMNKVSALSVLSNSVLVFNTLHYADIAEGLASTAKAPVDRAHLARISPLAHAHVIPSGTYHFDRAAASLPN